MSEAPIPPGLGQIEKLVTVLDLLTERKALTIAQLAALTQQPRSTLYRFVNRLEELKLVEPTSVRGEYRLGTHLLRWGTAMQASLDIRERARPVLNRLRDETGLTVYLLVRRDWQGVCIERIEGERVSSLLTQVGTSLPLHAGTAARALLAFEDEAFWHEYVSGVPLTRMTDRTPTTPEELFELLRRERAQGVCTSRGDVAPGIASFGAPVMDHRHHVIASISASGLIESVMGPDRDRNEHLVRAAAADISRSFGATVDAPAEAVVAPTTPAQR